MNNFYENGLIYQGSGYKIQDSQIDILYFISETPEIGLYYLEKYRDICNYVLKINDKESPYYGCYKISIFKDNVLHVIHEEFVKNELSKLENSTHNIEYTKVFTLKNVFRYRIQFEMEVLKLRNFKLYKKLNKSDKYNNSGFYAHILNNFRWVNEFISNFLPKYEYIDARSKYHRRKFKQNGLYGFLDQHYNIVIEPIYQYVYNYSQRLAAVKLNGKWGVINVDGTFLVEPIFDEVPGHFFKMGRLLVEYENQLYELDTNCEFLNHPIERESDSYIVDTEKCQMNNLYEYYLCDEDL